MQSAKENRLLAKAVYRVPATWEILGGTARNRRGDSRAILLFPRLGTFSLIVIRTYLVWGVRQYSSGIYKNVFHRCEHSSSFSPQPTTSWIQLRTTPACNVQKLLFDYKRVLSDNWSLASTFVQAGRWFLAGKLSTLCPSASQIGGRWFSLSMVLDSRRESLALDFFGSEPAR